MKFTVKVLSILMICSLVLCLTSCFECEHEWQKATCTSAKICKLCGEVEGEPLGHEWSDATCLKASTCGRCGISDGEKLKHNLVDGKCSNCGFDLFGKTWVRDTGSIKFVIDWRKTATSDRIDMMSVGVYKGNAYNSDKAYCYFEDITTTSGNLLYVDITKSGGDFYKLFGISLFIKVVDTKTILINDYEFKTL